MQPAGGSRQVFCLFSRVRRRPQAQSRTCRTQTGVERTERQIAALSKLKIAGVINAETESVRQRERGGPHARVAFAVDLDRQQSQFSEGIVAIALVDSLAPNCGLEAVCDFEPPQRRHESTMADDVGEH